MKRIFTKFSVLTLLCFLLTYSAFAQNITVKGKVTDGGDKTTIPSVSVQVKGTSTGAQTDVNGNYTISAAPNAVLVFTYIGYNTQEIPVNNNTTINVALVSASQQLDQVVVVGYGSQRKIDVTGAVASVKGEDISKQASVNPVSALQGKVAGVSITNVGTPGGAPKITIRGAGTIYGNTNVLYVVDGVWYDDISFLNPSDIASISILKDASSQSIYGIRAANGVVLVTTVRGKKGDATTINYNGTVGFQSVTNAVKMTNATEYAIATNEAYKILGKPALFANTDLGKGTDWYGRILRNAIVTNHQLSINGATEKTSYNLSAGYLNQDGIVKNNNYKRYTVRLTNDYQIFEALKIGYNVAGTSSTSKNAPTSIFRDLYAASPVVPVFKPDGSYGDPSDYQLGNGTNVNPQATLDFNNSLTNKYKLTGNVFAELKFAKHFTFKTSAGGDFAQEEVRNYTPKYFATKGQNTTSSTLAIDRIETRNWILENTLTYDNKFGDHNLTVLAGQTAQRFKTNTINASARNVPYTTEGDLYLALGDPDSRKITSTGTLNTATSYFGRVNYSYKNKYMLNASIRADAASQFYGSKLWGYFPSIGGGWVISNEDFMKDQKVFNNLKLRGSWGKVGNSGVPTNPSTAIIEQGGGLVAFFNGVAYTGANSQMIVPPVILWERSSGTDVGLEMGFLNNRLNIEADYYSRTTEQAIFGIPTFASLGTKNNDIIGNQADIRNRGFEFVASWSDQTSGGFKYSVSGNIGINTNKVLNVISGANAIFGGGAGLVAGERSTRTVVGRPIGEFYGYQVKGIFQTASEISASAQKDAVPGDFSYVDQNGDGVIDAKDKITLGNPNPKYTYGVNTNFAYKNFDLTLDIQGVAGVDVYNGNLSARFGNENFTKDFYDHRWTGPGSSNTYPSANLSGGKNIAPNSFYVESGAYIRMRNIQLGYTLPQLLTSKWKIQKLRVFANAQNAVNLFGYKGFSPEVGGTPTNAGLDVNVYPLYATYNFGVNLTF